MNKLVCLLKNLYCIKTIHAHKITNQVEVHDGAWYVYSSDHLIEPDKDVRTGLHTGRVGSLSVVYKTFVTKSSAVAHAVSV